MFGSAVTGIGIYVQQLVQALVASIGDDALVLLAREQDVAKLPRHGKVKVVPTDIPWYGWREQVKLPALLSGQQCDLWHFPNFNVPLFYRGKFVVTVHDLTPFSYPGPNQRRWWWRRAAYRQVMSSTIGRAVRVIAVSRSTAMALAQRWPRGAQNIRVVYPGVAPSFQPAKDYGIIKLTLERYHITPPYLFYTGVWRDHKNLPGLIAAFAELRKTYGFRGQLVLGGSRQGEDPKIAGALARDESGSIATPGFIPDADLPALFQGAAMTVVPSFAEGFGLIAVESLACGTPVAASRTTSVPEVIGDAGRYFPPDQPVEMAKVLRSLLDETERAKVRQIASSIVSRYRWDVTAEKTWSIYREAVMTFK